MGVLASLQSGLLIAKTARDSRPLAIALDAAIAHLENARAIIRASILEWLSGATHGL
jgi:hypothetical protein